MAAKESKGGQAVSFPLFNLAPAEFAAMGQKRMEEFVNAQTEFVEELRKANQQWLERAQFEANAGSEFASKLTSAHSIPEAMTACQEWTSRRFEMMAEDGKHLLADTQKFMEMGAHLLSSGWLSNGSAVSP